MAGAKRSSSATKTALDRALREVEREKRDGAAVALARQYAKAIDADASMLWRLGPRLLDTLVELGMTPKARQAVVRGGDEGDSGSGSGTGDGQPSRGAALHALQSDYDDRRAAAGEH